MRQRNKPCESFMRVYVPIEDGNLDFPLEVSEATGFTIEQLIQRAVTLILERGRRKR
jgi:hypothetical protein